MTFSEDFQLFVDRWFISGGVFPHRGDPIYQVPKISQSLKTELQIYRQRKPVVAYRGFQWATLAERQRFLNQLDTNQGYIEPYHASWSVVKSVAKSYTKRIDSKPYGLVLCCRLKPKQILFDTTQCHYTFKLFQSDSTYTEIITLPNPNDTFEIISYQEL